MSAELIQALDGQCKTFEDALDIVKAQRAFINELLHPEGFGWSVTKEVRDEARRVLGGQGSETAPRTFRRLALLGHHQGELSALLLGSFHMTHADVLRKDDFTEELVAEGIATAVGDFTHIPSGRRLIVAIAPIPLEA